MLFLHCFPELLATGCLEARGPRKEFQGEPRATGSPSFSLPALMVLVTGPAPSVGSSLRGPLEVQASRDQADFPNCE